MFELSFQDDKAEIIRFANVSRGKGRRKTFLRKAIENEVGRKASFWDLTQEQRARVVETIRGYKEKA